MQKQSGPTSERLKYLRLLSKQYPTARDCGTEIINLQAILNLPKGTEHFLTDVHGEYESFSHVMRNASGVIRAYIQELFRDTLLDAEMKSLATLVYYPSEKLRLVKLDERDLDNWYKVTLFRLIKLCKRASAKYTRSKVRKSIDPRFAYITEELLHEDGEGQTKQGYYNQIIDSIIGIGRADDYIMEISKVIRRLAIDRLHIVGDIFDRGPHPDRIIDELTRHHSVDIQWGNHDILWMGAAMGSDVCILNVIRISARYAHLAILEEGYGINLVPLAAYAIEYYGGGDMLPFEPREVQEGKLSSKELSLISQIHKAAAILQFKVEAAAIRRNPEFAMEGRLLLHKHERRADDFPTVDPTDPYRLTEEEAGILAKLVYSFQNSPRLREHIDFLFSKGSLYKVFNGNLLFHGGVPLDDDGSLREVRLGRKLLKGKELFDEIERIVRKGYFSRPESAERRRGRDMMWYLWCGADSPLFGSERMTTFERYFSGDPETHFEPKRPYYKYRDDEATIRAILADFGLDPETGHIISGHIPVKVAAGESPIKANGRLFVIDGGFAKAYQKTTGIAGYTLIYNSHGLVLVSHEPFESTQIAIAEERDIYSSRFVIEEAGEVVRVRNTDNGRLIQESINDLLELLSAYETGKIAEG